MSNLENAFLENFNINPQNALAEKFVQISSTFRRLVSRTIDANDARTRLFHMCLALPASIGAFIFGVIKLAIGIPMYVIGVSCFLMSCILCCCTPLMFGEPKFVFKFGEVFMAGMHFMFNGLLDMLSGLALISSPVWAPLLWAYDDIIAPLLKTHDPQHNYREDTQIHATEFKINKPSVEIYQNQETIPLIWAGKKENQQFKEPNIEQQGTLVRRNLSKPNLKAS